MLARAIGQNSAGKGDRFTMESGAKSTNAGHFSPEGGLHIVVTYRKCQFIGKVKSAYKPKWPIWPELIPVSVALNVSGNIATTPWMGC